MKIQVVFLCFILSLAVISGCDSGTATTSVQDIVELKWQSDGSAIYGFMQSYTLTSLSTTNPVVGYDIVRFNADGSIAQTYSNDAKSRSDISNSLYVSADGSAAVTQLEVGLYRVNLKTATFENLLPSVPQFHLIVVSPDLRYAIGTPSPANQPQKTINVYDLTTSPINLVTHFDVDSLSYSPGVWLGAGKFGLSVNDSIGEHISVYTITTTGAPTGIPSAVIANAQLRFHNFAFDTTTNDLFFRDRAGRTTDYTVEKVNLTSMKRSSVLNVAVEDFDVTNDESSIIYAAPDSTGLVSLRSRNLSTSHELPIATDFRLIISLSPSQTKLGYIRQRDVNYSEIRVIPFSQP